MKFIVDKQDLILYHTQHEPHDKPDEPERRTVCTLTSEQTPNAGAGGENTATQAIRDYHRMSDSPSTGGPWGRRRADRQPNDVNQTDKQRDKPLMRRQTG